MKADTGSIEKYPFSPLLSAWSSCWGGARKYKQTWNQAGLSFIGKTLLSQPCAWLGIMCTESLTPCRIPRNDQSPGLFTLELQAMPQAHLSWHWQLLGFPYYSQRTWVSPGASPSHGLSTWKSVPGLTVYCTDGCDRHHGMSKYVPECWKSTWEIYGIPNRRSVYATLNGSSRAHVFQCLPLYSL